MHACMLHSAHHAQHARVVQPLLMPAAHGCCPGTSPQLSPFPAYLLPLHAVHAVHHAVQHERHVSVLGGSIALRHELGGRGRQKKRKAEDGSNVQLKEHIQASGRCRQGMPPCSGLVLFLLPWPLGVAARLLPFPMKQSSPTSPNALMHLASRLLLVAAVRQCTPAHHPLTLRPSSITCMAATVLALGPPSCSTQGRAGTDEGGTQSQAT